MGVTGLWRLIEPAGKPVPVETLENKVLAVDISIWLHQMVKGYQDAKGAPLPNAHLMGLFQRLCKLLYFRIKPVFVFDGGFSDLKKETIAKRQDSKLKYNSESERLKRELALLLSKKSAVNSLLGKQISPKGKSTLDANSNDDIFKLPALPQKNEETESESEDEQNSSGSVIDLHSVDIESDNFKNLPTKDKYDLLMELKETRKMNSWGKLHELPKKSDNFSDFQMQRLLKRRKVQECIEETEKEMGDIGMSLNDLESLLNEEGIDTKIDSLATRRIASNESTRFLLISNVKKALADAKKKKEDNQPSTSKLEEEKPIEETKPPKRDELEEDLEKAIKMSLECVAEVDTSACTSKTDDSWTSVLTDTDYSDSEDEDGFEQPDNMSSAKAYIMQYSDFTHQAISKIVAPKGGASKSKCKVPEVDQIIEDLNKEKSIIVDNIHLSSSDDDCIQDDSNTVKKDVEDEIVALNTSEDSEMFVNNDEIMDVTQSSVVCVENSVQEVVTLDSSTEEKEVFEKDEKINVKSEHDSSESESDDFEDVPEIENKSQKPVVELVLNMDKVPDDDDIFADVFVTKEEPNVVKASDSKDATFYNIKSAGEEWTNTAEISKTDNIIEKIKVGSEGKQNKNDLEENSENKIVEKRSFPDKPTDKRPEQQSEIVVPNETSNKIISEKATFNNTDATNDELIPIHSSKQPIEPISTDQLNSIAEEIQNEERDLLQEKGRLDRIGRNITEQMTKEAQELLQIFGIPYIVAPMEAEAQCAFLESVKLTDGTITDDSDIWLFGGRTVYKNFFNQKKHVLQFLAERIERSFNLTREQLVLLALLVGSDYTTGLTGVGPVTALEILASFPFNKKQFINETSKQARYSQIVAGLQEFKKWVRAGKRTDNTTLKKKLKNIDLTDDFPSVRVVQAYLEPNIEKSEEKFTWGELDITVLRDYTKAKFGWSQNKLDEIIKPVLKRMIDRKTQKSVYDYFKKKVEHQSLDEHMSKRVKAAIQRMGPEVPLSEEVIPAEVEDKPKNKKGMDKNKVTKSGGAAGPSKAKRKKITDQSVLNEHSVKVVAQIEDGAPNIEIKIPKSDRVQEIIPQREKDKRNLLENKLKAIEIFRKTNIDRKRKFTKRKVNLPKEKAELSETSDSD